MFQQRGRLFGLFVPTAHRHPLDILDVRHMPFLESALGKALAAAGRFLPQLSTRAEARLITDHRPISGSPNFHGGGQFWLWVVVAPSHSPKQLEPLEFTEAAYELAKLVFDEQQFVIDYSGSELCRFVVYNADLASQTRADHWLWIHPDGRVFLQWGLQTSSLANTRDVELSLDEIVAVLGQMHHVVHDPRFAAIHARRRPERFRRLDWRVGLTPSISTNEHGQVYWRRLSSSTRLPAVVPSGQNPSCPVRGFAPHKMMSIKQGATMVEIFGPALEHLLVDAGYTGGVRETVRDALRSGGTRQVETATSVPAIGDRDQARHETLRQPPEAAPDGEALRPTAAL